MRLDKLTTKLQEALADAQSQAVGNDNQYIEPVHLLIALLNQDDGSSRSLLQRAGVNIGGLSAALKASLGRLAKVTGTGGEVQIGRELSSLLNLADKEAQKRNDQFIASLYAHNIAKVLLARAIGNAEQAVKLYLSEPGSTLPANPAAPPGGTGSPAPAPTPVPGTVPTAPPTSTGVMGEVRVVVPDLQTLNSGAMAPASMPPGPESANVPASAISHK